MSKHGLWLAMLLASGGVCAQDEGEDAGEAGWHGGAWLLSDYVFRGVSQSQEHFAGQGELYYQFENGFYAGLWGSSVDFTAPGDEDDDVDFEFDPYIGWSGDLSDSLSLDVILIRQIYPSDVEGVDYDYNELEVKLWFGNLYGHLGWSNDVFNSDETGTYFSVGTEWPLGDTPLTLLAHVGWYDLDDSIGGSYSDWRLGVQGAIGESGFLWRAEYTDTGSYDEALEDFVGGPDEADARFAFTLGYEF